MKKILIPTDFSEPSATAMTQAASIAKKFGAQILFIHLYGFQSEKSNLIINITDLLAENAQQTMEEMLSEFRQKHPDLAMDGICEEGNMISGLNQAILRHKANMMIMSVDTSNLNDVFSGKHTSLLLSKMIAPVLVVSNESKNISPHQILLISENNKALDSSIKMVNKVFENPKNVFFKAPELDEFALSMIHVNAQNREKMKTNKGFDNNSTHNNPLEEKNMDLLVFTGKKRKTWLRFLRSETGQALAGQSNSLILICPSK